MCYRKFAFSTRSLAALPDGTTRAVRLWDGDGHEESDFKTTELIDFTPSHSAVRPYLGNTVNDVGVSVKQ